MSQLQNIQTMTQQIAEAMWSVLEMDVTIVDNQMQRIAGTGCHFDTIGHKITDNSVYYEVLHKAKEYVITDVRTNHECKDCDKYDMCRELAQLCCPIMFKNKIIGIIALIAFSSEQKKILDSKKTALLGYIRKMAELISAKVVEKQSHDQVVFMKQQLETVLNFVPDGIIAIDKTAHIISINYAGAGMLKIKMEDALNVHIGEIFPGTPIEDVILSKQGFMNKEVKVWRNGRYHHYFINAKPMLVGGQIEGVVANFRSASEWQADAVDEVKVYFNDIIGTSNAILRVKEEAIKVADSISTVLIRGESGTGKELFAKAIHNESDRSDRAFIAVNCAAIPENLLESELFGYEDGAFTGAKKGGKAGKFQLANGGTLFLDEIGDMPITLQAKILRVLQEHVVERIGAVKVTPVDVRIIAATHCDLEEKVKAGSFREDLYYRLNVFPLMLPSLRQRHDDIILLAEFFLQKITKKYHKCVNGFSTEAKDYLKSYTWPGNIRELENTIERAVIKANQAALTVAEVSVNIAGINDNCRFTDVKEKSEKAEIIDALMHYAKDVNGKKKAAVSLNMSLATLYRKIHKYQI